MSRPVTLFTGQWADLPLETLTPLAKKMGYDGLELAAGNHFDVDLAAVSKEYRKQVWDILSDNGLNCWAVSNHLVGQAVCDLIDERHRAILPNDVWGDGDPEGVRKRAAKKMILTVKAIRTFMNEKPKASAAERKKAAIFTGFTGSSIWHTLYAFPPTDQDTWDKGFADFAKRFAPILDACEKQNVNFALEVHPTEIAFDTATAQRALAAVKNHKRFGFNYDPSHFGYQGVDYVKFIRLLGTRIFHCHIKDVWWKRGDGTVGVFGGHTSFGDPRRNWEFRSPGHGDIRFEDIIVALNDVGYNGPLSVEWEDGRMDREYGAAEALQFTRKLDFKPSATRAFDAAFSSKK